jgi:hypothetical protein
VKEDVRSSTVALGAASSNHLRAEALTHPILDDFEFSTMARII